jgi:hypothetical protein
MKVVETWQAFSAVTKLVITLGAVVGALVTLMGAGYKAVAWVVEDVGDTRFVLVAEQKSQVERLVAEQKVQARQQQVDILEIRRDQLRRDREELIRKQRGVGLTDIENERLSQVQDAIQRIDERLKALTAP